MSEKEDPLRQAESPAAVLLCLAPSVCSIGAAQEGGSSGHTAFAMHSRVCFTSAYSLCSSSNEMVGTWLLDGRHSLGRAFRSIKSLIYS